jgi:hypothetical protein
LKSNAERLDVSITCSLKGRNVTTAKVRRKLEIPSTFKQKKIRYEEAEKQQDMNARF